MLLVLLTSNSSNFMSLRWMLELEAVHRALLLHFSCWQRGCSRWMQHIKSAICSVNYSRHHYSCPKPSYPKALVHPGISTVLKIYLHKTKALRDKYSCSITWLKGAKKFSKPLIGQIRWFIFKISKVKKELVSCTTFPRRSSCHAGGHSKTTLQGGHLILCAFFP